MLKISKYLAIAMASTIKFVGGPLAGVGLMLSWWETAIFSTVGLMFTVVLVIYGGDLLEKWILKFRGNKPKKVFSRTTRMGIKVKTKLGLWGIAFLTPLIFTPIVGSFLSLSFRFDKTEILYKMLICGLFWGAVQTLFFMYVKQYLFPLL
jgi:hypothetical protein